MEAEKHAVRAEALQNELDGFSRCIQESVSYVVPSGCPETAEETFGRISEYAEAIQNELSLSHGLSTAVLIGQKHAEQLEIRPASRNAAVDTMIGAVLGLLIAAGWVWVNDRRSADQTSDVSDQPVDGCR